MIAHRDLPPIIPLPKPMPSGCRGCPARIMPGACFVRNWSLIRPLRPSTLWWSGSQRCTIWLNGMRIADGPARSDRETWPWVSTRIPSLGRRSHIAWRWRCTRRQNMRERGRSVAPPSGSAPSAIRPWRPGKVTLAWTCCHDQSRTALLHTSASAGFGHHAVGKGHQLDAAEFPWGWTQNGFADGDLGKPTN